MGKELTWLHISDLHAGKPEGWDMDQVLDALLDDLKTMNIEQGLRPDLIFFTGDLAYGQDSEATPQTMEEQYDLAENFLSTVRKAYEPEISRSALYLVPGNHDINRKFVTDAEKTYISSAALGDLEKTLDQSEHAWETYNMRQSEYLTFLRKYKYEHLLTIPKHATFGAVANVSGVNIGIVGLNSAWSCSGQREKGKLRVAGQWQLQKARPMFKQCDFSIVLSHHPTNWFSEDEDPAIARSIENGHSFFLHGHEHQAWVDERGGAHVRIAAAACYCRGDNEENGYNIVRINLNTQKGEVWLRKYDSQGEGWVPRVVAKKTSDSGMWPIVWKSRKRRDVEQGMARQVSGSNAVAEFSGDIGRLYRRVVVTVPPIGRDAEANDSLSLLQTSRALLLYGSPGQGKSVLARYIAAMGESRFPDGAFEIDLQNEKQLENILKRIGIALGQEDASDVISALNEKRVLIILDSIEGIIKHADREQVSRYFDMLLSALHGSSRILITSQTVFDKQEIPGKRVLPLEKPFAIELFLRESDDLYAREDPAEIAEFVQTDLGAHPLSIKIVARYAALAARVDLRSLRDLWRQRFNAVADFEPSLDAKPLVASFELSYESLTDNDRRYFLALALLPDGLLGKHVAEIWVHDIESAYRSFGILEQRSLLESERQHRRMVGPLLLYAQAKRRSIEATISHPLRAVLGEDLISIDKFSDGLVERYAPQEIDEDPAEKNLTIRQFFFNVHASLDRRLDPSIDEQSLAAAYSVIRLYWAYHNNLSGHNTTLATADDALHYLNKAHDIFTIHKNNGLAIQCRYYVGNILWLRGDVVGARKHLEDVLQSDVAAEKLKYNARRAFAHIEYKTGDISRAALLYEEVAKQASFDDMECYVRCYIGLLDAYRKLEKFELTREMPELVSQVLPELSAGIRGNVIRGLAYANLAGGNPNAALDGYQHALMIFQKVSPFGQAHCHRGLGDTYVELQRFDDAQCEFNHAMRLYEEAGKERSLGVGLVMIGRGRLFLAKRDLASAQAVLRAAAELLDDRHLNEPYEQAQAHELLGQTFVASNQSGPALGYFQLALQQYRRSGCERPAARVAERITGLCV